MRLRKIIIATHRDLGYLFAGLTVMYAISGVAVNHIHHWNPSFDIDWTVHQVGAFDSGADEAIVAQVLEHLEIEEQPNAVIRTAPERLEIFLEGRTLQVDTSSGRVADERVSTRPVLFELNYLHLNNAKGLWTWVADAYALGLLILALTGIFILRGKKGLGGRGRWLLLTGVAIPVVFLIVKLS